MEKIPNHYVACYDLRHEIPDEGNSQRVKIIRKCVVKCCMHKPRKNMRNEFSRLPAVM